jgi:hypothetical protein
MIITKQARRLVYQALSVWYMSSPLKHRPQYFGLISQYLYPIIKQEQQDQKEQTEGPIASHQAEVCIDLVRLFFMTSFSEIYLVGTIHLYRK